MKLLKLLFIFTFLLCGNAYSQSLKPLENWVAENANSITNTGESLYFSSRCSAVNLYVSVISQNDAKVSKEANDLYHFYRDLHIAIAKDQLKISNQQALKNFLENVKNIESLYAKDGQMNYARTGMYVTGYIMDDFRICNRLKNRLIKR